VSVASRKYRALTQVNPSLLVLKSFGKKLAVIGKNKSVGPDSVSGEILKLGGETMIPYIARFFDIKINNSTIPSDWIKAIVIPIYKGVTNRWSEVTDPSV
jgi:hypothetical protein